MLQLYIFECVVNYLSSCVGFYLSHNLFFYFYLVLKGINCNDADMAFRHQTPFIVKSAVIMDKLQLELQGRKIKALDDDQRAVLFDVLESFSRHLPGK